MEMHQRLPSASLAPLHPTHPPLSSPVQILEHAVKHYDVKFVLKTDDDAFVNIGVLIAELRSLCINPDCSNERLYVGRMARHSEVLLQHGHKWNNDAFYNHTGRVQCISGGGGRAGCVHHAHPLQGQLMNDVGKRHSPSLESCEEC